MSVQEEDPEMSAKAECSSLDIISTIPQNIIENILCLVPIKEALRTSILSRKWKHSWITIPKLIFIENDMFEETTQHQTLFRIPRSLFALNQLTDLCINYCFFDFDHVSSGFGNLTSLSLIDVNIPEKSLLQLLSCCPKLKSFNLSSRCVQHGDYITIIRLLNCLRVIEHLSYSRWYYQTFAVNSDPRELPSTLVHLKYFHLDEMMLIDNYGLEFVALVIRSSPNIEKIKLEIEDQDPHESVMEFAALQECSNIWLEHFKELKVVNFVNREGEMKFVKLILAKSPVLEKVTIVLENHVRANGIKRHSS